MDHSVLVHQLIRAGLSKNTIGWFENYLTDRTQSVQVEGLSSSSLNITKGVPQGSVLGPLLFILYINNINWNISNAKFHFYADDTVMYTSASSPVQALAQLQFAFNAMQQGFYDLKLVLNADKTKVMLFSNSKSKLSSLPSVITAQGSQIELVSSYKYLGVVIDDSLSFSAHIQQLVKKLKLKLGFFFRIKSCLSFESRKRLVSATFMSVLDYGDVLYMHASSNSLHSLDTVYHGALRFITGFKSLTHHCLLYARVGWSSLSARRLNHWRILIYKCILGLLPSYLLTYISQKSTASYNLRSQDLFLLSVPKVRTELGKKAFRFAAPHAWNELQKDLKLKDLVSLDTFKSMLSNLEANTSGCRCFD